MDITCPEFEPIEVTSDYGSRETSGAEADPIMGFCLTEFGRTGKWAPFLFFKDGDSLGNKNFISYRIFNYSNCREDR